MSLTLPLSFVSLPQAGWTAVRRRAAPEPPIRPALGRFTSELWAACTGAAKMAGERGVGLRLTCDVRGEPAAAQQDVVLRIIWRLVLDAAERRDAHGTAGRVEIQVRTCDGAVTVEIADDVWQSPRPAPFDRHRRWARRLAEAAGGTMTQRSGWEGTMTRATIPAARNRFD